MIMKLTLSFLVEVDSRGEAETDISNIRDLVESHAERLAIELIKIPDDSITYIA
jgi:hypothetical protein